MSEKERLIQEGLLNVREVEAIAGVKKSKIYELMSSGELPYVKIGSARRIPKRGLLDYLSANLVIRD